MSAEPATTLFRSGMLADRVVLAAVPAEGLGASAANACSELEASVLSWEDRPRDEESAEDVVAGALAQAGRVDVLLVEAGPDLPGDPDAALLTALAETWNVVRATANAAFIPGEGGKIVLVGPRPGACEHAEALRAGLENMARTLSIEWARFQVRPTMIAPGASTTDAEVAGLAVYLASPAGDYYSGCRFDLRSV